VDHLNHWRYFLSLEREFSDSLRYVELTESQLNVHSFEFARLLILTCSELDVVFKIACDSVSPAEKAGKIGPYFSCLIAKYKFVTEAVRLYRYGRRVLPFEHWTEVSPPSWWTAQNKVKHYRHEEFHQATLGNAMAAMCGLFVVNLMVLNELSLLDLVHETPVVLGRDSEPGHLLLESGYLVAQR
jgi:hypothetical protein